VGTGGGGGVGVGIGKEGGGALMVVRMQSVGCEFEGNMSENQTVHSVLVL